jgi:NADPH-dependent 7-cyano-7-deazaguanine reductase QueF
VSAEPARLEIVDEPADVDVCVTATLVHRCPHVPEVDAGEVRIGWRCAGKTVELHSLAGYLASWEAQAVSHEDVTEQIRADLAALEGIENVGVSSAWTTAGMAVTVQA